MNVFKILEEKGYILFFNQGDKYTGKFTFSQNRRSNFFWYHDSFFSHFSIEKQDRYLHIFIKKQNDYDFAFMQDNKNWDDVYNHFLKNKDKLKKEENLKNLKTYNPPILRSSDLLVPDLIFDFEKEGNIEAVCVFPEKYKELRCKFFDNKHFPVDFIDIPKLNEIILNI